MAARLVQTAGNIRYLKLEEALMGAKVRAICKATHNQVRVFEGWGGMYLLELMPEGIAGAMPGLSMCDLFVRVFSLASAGDLEKAFELCRFMLPQIVFSL
jgi:4-hydroxy-tetrahydrodipicolinate synthase